MEGLGVWPLLWPLRGLGDANSSLSLLSRSLMAPRPPWLLGGPPSAPVLEQSPAATFPAQSWHCSSSIDQEVFTKHEWNPNSHPGLIPELCWFSPTFAWELLVLLWGFWSSQPGQIGWRGTHRKAASELPFPYPHLRLKIP